jgi:hypothetical protein
MRCVTCGLEWCSESWGSLFLLLRCQDKILTHVKRFVYSTHYFPNSLHHYVKKIKLFVQNSLYYGFCIMYTTKYSYTCQTIIQYIKLCENKSDNCFSKFNITVIICLICGSYINIFREENITHVVLYHLVLKKKKKKGMSIFFLIT